MYASQLGTEILQELFELYPYGFLLANSRSGGNCRLTYFAARGFGLKCTVEMKAPRLSSPLASGVEISALCILNFAIPAHFFSMNAKFQSQEACISCCRISRSGPPVACCNSRRGTRER